MAEAKTGKGGAKGSGKPTGKDAAKDSAQDAEKGSSKAAAKTKKPAAEGKGDTKAATTARAEPFVAPADYAPRLKKHYEEVVRPRLIEQFGYKNRFEVPGIEKIVLNMGVGEAVNDTKKVTLAAADLPLRARQK